MSLSLPSELKECVEYIIKFLKTLKCSRHALTSKVRYYSDIINDGCACVLRKYGQGYHNVNKCTCECRDFGFPVASVDMKRGEGSPGRQLDLEDLSC